MDTELSDYLVLQVDDPDTPTVSVALHADCTGSSGVTTVTQSTVNAQVAQLNSDYAPSRVRFTY